MTSQLPTLKKRNEFLAAHRRGRKLVAKGFLLQVRKRQPAEAKTQDISLSPRIGFTASKKVGNAVCRSFAKRRLRALAHEFLRPDAKQNWDYVLIARPETTTRDFADLIGDLKTLLETLKQKGTDRHSGPKKPRHRQNTGPGRKS